MIERKADRPRRAAGPAGTVHLGEALRRTAAVAPERDAVVFPDSRITYADLYARSLHRAASLRALGLGPGDHIGLLLTNRPEFAELLLGSAIAGCVAVLINARYKPHELRHVVPNADLRCLITSVDADGDGYDFPSMLIEAVPEMGGQRGDKLTITGAPLLRRVFVIGDPTAHPFEPYADLVALGDHASGAEQAEATLPERSVSEPLIMLYTSGTTSAPKGCRLSHLNLVGKGLAFAEVFDFGAGDRMWNPLPVFHVGFVMPLAGAIATAATIVTMRWFEPAAAIRQLADERITHAMPSFPQLWQGVIDHPDFAATDLPSLRRGLLVGPVDLLCRVQRATPGCPFISCYGMTEGTSVFTAPRPADPEAIRLGTEGRPMPGLELRIVDRDTGAELPRDCIGEIEIRGYAVATGYHNAPPAAADAFRPDGWFRTGDLGSVDTAGNLSFRGRAKDMFKVGGENVAALEVESFLCTHPEIVMAQVIGVPDRRLGEVVRAFVELRPGAALEPAGVVEYCRGKVATFKIPRYVTLVTEWPMSATKVQKRALVDLPLGPRLL